MNFTVFVIVMLLAVSLIPCLVTLETNRWYNRHHTKWLTTQKREIEEARQRLVAERLILQADREAMTKAQQDFRRSAKEAAAVLHSEEQHMDDETVISLIDWENLPIREPDDTVAIPTVKDE